MEYDKLRASPKTSPLKHFSLTCGVHSHSFERLNPGLENVRVTAPTIALVHGATLERSSFLSGKRGLHRRLSCERGTDFLTTQLNPQESAYL